MVKIYEDITLVKNPHSMYTDDEITHFYAQGFWQRDFLTDYLDRNAKVYPDKLAVYDTVKRISYSQLQVMAYTFSNALLKLGITKGDRVVVQLPGSVEYAVSYFGISRIGAIMAPAMTIYREHELHQVVCNTEAKVLIIPGTTQEFDYPGMALRLKEKCKSLEYIIVVSETVPSNMLGFNALLDNSTPLDPSYPKPDPDDVHILLQTAGSETKIKSCAHSWNTVRYSSQAMGILLGLTENDVCLMPSPVAHTTGLALGIITPLIFGIGTVIMNKWDADNYLNLIQTEKCTYSVGAAPFMTMTLSAYDPKRHDVSSFRCFASGGAPIPGDLASEYSKVLNCSVITVYGCSETLVATITRLEDPLELTAESDGRALMGVDLRIEKQDKKIAELREVGEVIFKSPGMMLGYWGAVDVTNSSFDSNGWFHSGDLASMINSGGYIRISGRRKDIIIRGGVNVSAREVEEALRNHPKVEDIAVVAMPDERLGEKLCAFIVVKPGETLPSIDDIDVYLSQLGFARHKVPERIEQISAIPMNAGGKVQKYYLRNLVREKLMLERVQM